MRFHAPLLEGVLLKRHKRFLAEVRLASGEEVTAHCVNPGSMLSVREPGSRVWLSPALNTARKLRYTWEIIEVDGNLVGINTARPNVIVAEAIAAREVPALASYPHMKREQKYGRNSRIDLLLEGPGQPPCYVEIKNVTMRRGPAAPAEFPDSVTARGTKHLQELAEIARSGAKAVMFYLVQRADCRRFTIAHDIDPTYAKALKSAVDQGVSVLCYSCRVAPNGIHLDTPLTLDLPA